MENKVVIFSNGIADFQQTYQVSSEKECKVSIPVKHNHIADVLGSFNVYGNVRLASPPTFTPENNRYGALSIDSSRVYEDMATKLSGAQVIVSHPGGTIEGQLIGVQKEPEGTNGDPITPYSVVVMTKTGLQRCKINDIANMEFLEKEVRTEIDKVLQEKLRAIKPNSTFVDFVLTTEENSTEAVVQYTLPVAAWKISYRFHLGEDNKATLQGFAIVDNSTEQDWKDYKVCVVTGMPITFSTDIASSKTPRREHVDVVAESAIGAVYVSDDDMIMEEPGEGFSYSMLEAAGSARDSEVQYRSSERSYVRGTATPREALAHTSAAEIQEVGDFCVFESIDNVDIPANRSSVIPVFNADVDSVVPVLHYALANHHERPFRAIDFVNGTGHSLGSGVCIVYDQGMYSGSCVMPAMKPNEQRLLSHALETGVKVGCKLGQAVTKRTAVVLDEGFCHLKYLQTRETEYKIKNGQSNAFKFYLDHIQLLRESQLKCTLVVDDEKSEIEPYSKISGGVRFNIQLPANASIVVQEKSLLSEKVELIVKSNRQEQAKIDWLVANVIDSDVPIKLGPEVQQIKKLLASLRETRDQVAKLAETSNQVNEKQERLRKNIKTAGKDELTKKWIKELDEAEKQIQSIDEKKIPALRLKEDEIHQQIVDLIRSISAEWIDDGKSD